MQSYTFALGSFQRAELGQVPRSVTSRSIPNQSISDLSKPTELNTHGRDYDVVLRKCVPDIFASWPRISQAAFAVCGISCRLLEIGRTARRSPSFGHKTTTSRRLRAAEQGTYTISPFSIKAFLINADKVNASGHAGRMTTRQGPEMELWAFVLNWKSRTLELLNSSSS